MEGNRQELAIIRVPSEEEEQLPHVHRQREALVRARTKLQAQGRGLLVSHGLPAPAHWWRNQTWGRFTRALPGWMITRLEVFRPVLQILDAQIAALSAELEAAAPKDLPTGLGKLTSVESLRARCATGAASPIGARWPATRGCVRASIPAEPSGCRAA